AFLQTDQGSLPVRAGQEEPPILMFRYLFAICEATHPSKSLVAVYNMAFKSTAVYTGKISFEEHSIACLRSAQRLLRLLPLGYITQEPFQIKQRLALKDANTGLLNPAPLSRSSLE